MSKTAIVKDVCTKFPQFPTRALARYLLDQYGGLWDYDYEKIRSNIRYYRGQHGETLREQASSIIISDVKMPKSWNRHVRPYNAEAGSYLILSDIHAPFHEIIAIEAAIKFGQKEKITHVFLNGDAHDCQSMSFWPSVVRKDFMAEVSTFIQLLDFIRKEFPKAKIIYKPGNHEFRLPRYYAQHFPELMNSPIAAMESLIDFESRGIEFLDYFQRVNLGKLPIYHGHEFRTLSTAVNPARGLFLKAKKWSAVSHFHRTSEHTDTDIDDTYMTTWSFGCLCNLHPEYMPVGGNWNWGCAIVSFDKSGNFEVQNRRILKNGAVV